MASEDYTRWLQELDAARESVKKWHTRGDKVLKAYLDERESSADTETHWNLFHGNITTLRSLLYGQPPQVTVSRRFADAQDDAARVAGEAVERILNSDLDDDGEDYCAALQNALEDRLLPGLGCARIRYEVETELGEETPAVMSPDGRVLAEPVAAVERITSEAVEVDYVHWRDFLWSPSRTWGEVRWLAFRAEMTREALVARFGEELGAVVPLSASKTSRDDSDAKKDDPRDRAEVWEVWDKERGEVVWMCREYPALLDRKADPLGLAGFFPCPRPMLANCTTSKVMPLPDYVLAQDLYRAVNDKSTRIAMLEDAVRVVGVYDKSAGVTVERVVAAGRQNQLIPVDNWAVFAEKGGMRGVVDWLPLEQVGAAIGALREARREDVDALYQVTGMSDIMRGQASAAGATATEQAIKARSGSVRVQALQDDFARFASELQALKAEVISLHFQPETIAELANLARTPDAHLAAEAVALVKSPSLRLRVEVKSESVSLTDFAALRSERTEVLVALSTFLSSAGPLMGQMPGATPYLLQMLQWALSGLKGAAAIEGVLDQAIAQAQQSAAQPQQAAPPDPKVMAQQMKGAHELQKIQADLQADLMRSQAEVQADEQREQNQAKWNVREAQAKQQISDASKAQQAVLTGRLR